MQLLHPKARLQPYRPASGGWGSAHSVMTIFWREQALCYPQCNPLVLLWHHAGRSKVPAAKCLPVTLHRSRPSAADLKHAVPAGDQVG